MNRQFLILNLELQFYSNWCNVQNINNSILLIHLVIQYLLNSRIYKSNVRLCIVILLVDSSFSIFHNVQNIHYQFLILNQELQFYLAKSLKHPILNFVNPFGKIIDSKFVNCSQYMEFIV